VKTVEIRAVAQVYYAMFAIYILSPNQLVVRIEIEVPVQAQVVEASHMLLAADLP
jgi:hypothetical protein